MNSASYGLILSNGDHVMIHYGVLGMKWGVRHEKKYRKQIAKAISKDVKLFDKANKMDSKYHSLKQKEHNATISKKTKKASKLYKKRMDYSKKIDDAFDLAESYPNENKVRRKYGQKFLNKADSHRAIEKYSSMRDYMLAKRLELFADNHPNIIGKISRAISSKKYVSSAEHLNNYNEIVTQTKNAINELKDFEISKIPTMRIVSSDTNGTTYAPGIKYKVKNSF